MIRVQTSISVGYVDGLRFRRLLELWSISGKTARSLLENYVASCFMCIGLRIFSPGLKRSDREAQYTLSSKCRVSIHPVHPLLLIRFQGVYRNKLRLRF